MLFRSLSRLSVPLVLSLCAASTQLGNQVGAPARAGSKDLRLDAGGVLSSMGGWLAIALFVIVAWALIKVPLAAPRADD